MTDWRYETPLFSLSDPMVCHTITLRPALWGVLFNELQRLGTKAEWRQIDPANATVDEVVSEIQTATDVAVFSGCLMIGQILELALDSVPSWLLPCDGSVYSDDDYPELGAVIHANLREGPDTFRVPDRVRRFGMYGEPVGDQGGEENHVLTIAEMPAHSHTVTDPGLNIVQEGAADPVLSDPGLPTQTGDTGGGAAHNNMPPWEGSQFYIIARYPTS